MQGIHDFIPTEAKISYHQQLLRVGFYAIDLGSFVSPKAIPQMADTGTVVEGLEYTTDMAKLLVIIANLRGARDAVQYDKISLLGFPFSISETFQIRNTNATREEAFDRMCEIQDLAMRHGKELVVYFSMCFGNPYGDLWHPDLVAYWGERCRAIGARTIALSDTTAEGNVENIGSVVDTMKRTFEDMNIGVHLHTRPQQWKEKVQAAYDAGCTRFDGAIRGFGGCPMAQDDMVGNMPTENLLEIFEKYDIEGSINLEEFQKARRMSFDIMREL